MSKVKITRSQLTSLIREATGSHDKETLLIREYVRELHLSRQLLNEGIFDFFVGIFNSILRLFGVEIKKYEVSTYKDLVSSADRVITKEKIINRKTKKPYTWKELTPKKKDHVPVLAKAINAAMAGTLKGLASSLEGMMDIPPVPKKPEGEDDKAAAEQYKSYEGKMKGAASELGKLMGVAKFLGDKYPEFKKAHDTASANPPTAPIDVFHQSEMLAKTIKNSSIMKGVTKESFNNMVNNILLEQDSPVSNISADIDKIISVAGKYFSKNSDYKRSGDTLPSTQAEGETGEAAAAAQEKAKEQTASMADVKKLVSSLTSEQFNKVRAWFEDMQKKDMLSDVAEPIQAAIKKSFKEQVDVDLPQSVKTQADLFALASPESMQELEAAVGTGGEEGKMSMKSALKGIMVDPSTSIKSAYNESEEDAAILVALMLSQDQKAGIELFSSLDKPQLAPVVVALANLKSVSADRLIPMIAKLAEIPDDQVPDMKGNQPISGFDLASDLMYELPDLLQAVAAIDASLGDKLIGGQFRINDLLKLNSREIQMLLREDVLESFMVIFNKMDIKNDELPKYILSNMSSRDAKIFVEDMERDAEKLSRGNVKAAKEKIVEIVLRLGEEGSINFRKGDRL